MKRGWCPTLEKPMETGDGLLVRFAAPQGVLKSHTARALAALTTTHGNGLLDLTRYANLQIRGVTAQSYAPLHEALLMLGLQEPSRTQTALNSGFELGLPFGRMDAVMLIALADLADGYGNGTIIPATQRMVFLPSAPITDVLLDAAAAAGFITDPVDARRAIEACPGAPACAQALGDTRQVALTIATALPQLAASNRVVHVSGCAKGCAWPKLADAVVTAKDGGYNIAFRAKAGEAQQAALSRDDVVRALAEALA